MAHGQNAQKWGHCGRDYWSRRLPGKCCPWGKAGKMITHERERAERKRLEFRLKVGIADPENT